MIRAILRNFGIQPQRIASTLTGLGSYLGDRKAYRSTSDEGEYPWGRELPILHEKTESSGAVGGYFLQDQTVARWVYSACPRRHVDIGSRLDGFVGSLSVFREVEVIDIRPQPLAMAGVRFRQLDVMKPLEEEWVECTDSLSCLHSIEHFGLGRYGDPIDPEGHLKGLAQMKAMVEPGGIFYLSTQIGSQRVNFNAHRVFAPETVIGWFSDGWAIERCAFIDEECNVLDGTNARILGQFRGTLGVGIVAARKIP